jgi:hypothetical protein
LDDLLTDHMASRGRKADLKFIRPDV